MQLDGTLSVVSPAAHVGHTASGGVGARVTAKFACEVVDVIFTVEADNVVDAIFTVDVLGEVVDAIFTVDVEDTVAADDDVQLAAGSPYDAQSGMIPPLANWSSAEVPLNELAPIDRMFDGIITVPSDVHASNMWGLMATFKNVIDVSDLQYVNSN